MRFFTRQACVGDRFAGEVVPASWRQIVNILHHVDIAEAVVQQTHRLVDDLASPEIVRDRAIVVCDRAVVSEHACGK